MFRSIAALGAAIIFISDASAIAVPAPQSQNAVSVLCSALTGTSLPSACLATATTTTTPATATTAIASTVSVPAACTSGATPNDGTASCWADMDLTTYVNDWWTANQGSCDGTGSGSSTSSFANCWYKIVVPNESPSVCDVLNSGGSCKEPVWTDFSRDNAEADFWVTWSIYNVNAFWTSMNSAIIAAGSQVTAITGKVVTALNPPEPPSIPTWEYVLDALTFATSLWSEGSTLTKAIVRAIPQTSTLTSKVFPQGEVEGTVTEWADVEYQVSNFITQWGQSIGDAVPLVANDVASFTSMASIGQFTGGVFDLSALTTSIHTVLGTYLTSVAAVATNYIITRTAGQSIAEIQGSTPLLWDTGCGDGYDNGVCGPFYYDGTDTYSLVSQQKWQTDQTDLFATLFTGETPVADPSLFFTGSLACTTSDDNGNGVAKPTLNQDDPATFTCLASNRVCTWNWDLQNVAFVDSDPFLPNCNGDDLPGINDFRCGTGAYSTQGHCVPFAYFGPEIETSYGTTVCHTNCGGGDVS